MLAIGVDNEAGSAPTVDNLKAVSGPTEGVDGDYAAPTVTQLQSFLAEYAAAQCGARVYIRKFLQNDQTNQSDWGYSASDPPNSPAPTFQDDDPRTHGNPAETGAFYNQLPSTSTEITIGEDANGQPINPFELTGVVCKYDSYDGQTAVQGSLDGLNYTFDVDRGDDIYCTFTNEPKTTLTVDKTPNDQTINAGDDAEFTIAVQNTGNNTATSATLSDQLPAPGATSWTVSQQPSSGSCSVDGSNVLTCAFGNIPAGETRTLKVKTTTSYAKCDVYDNPVATADADNASPVNDAGKITCQKPDLTITKTPNAQNINAGDDVVFDITVANSNAAGTGTAKGVTLTDPLPQGVAGDWSLVAPVPTGCTIDTSDPQPDDRAAPPGTSPPARASRSRSRPRPTPPTAAPTTTPPASPRPTTPTAPTRARSPARSPT